MSMVGMDPGQLSELVTILEDTGSARDAGGGQGTPNFTALSSNSDEWVRIRRLSAWTRRQAEQLGSPVEVEITMRSRSDIDSRNRLTWGSSTLILVSGPVNLDERGEYITFQAREDRD